jgi:hypothetical protein
MAHANLPGERAGVEQTTQPFVDLSLLLANVKSSVMKHGDAGAVITAILEAAQPFEDDGGRFFSANISNDATHDGNISAVLAIF